MGTKGEDSPWAVHAASSVRAGGSSLDIQASMPETCAVEHLLGTRLGSKGWEYREPEERGLGTVGSNAPRDAELGEAPGSPEEKAADQRRGWLRPGGEGREQHSRPRETLAEPRGVAGPALPAEGAAPCARSVLNGVGPGELSWVLGSGLWT